LGRGHEYRKSLKAKKNREKMKDKRHMKPRVKLRSAVLLTVFGAMIAGGVYAADKAPASKKKLKIVFLMGQSNMVGYAAPRTAWYLTQPAYVPPAEVGKKTAKVFNWDHYWSGVRYASGDSEEYNAKGEALLKERQEIRSLWRSRYYSNFSRAAKNGDNWNYKEWGEPPNKLERFKGMGMRDFMKVWLHEKAEEAGLYKRMEEYIESSENKFHPSFAIAEISKRDGYIAEDLKRVREIFLKGTKAEDFDKMAKAREELLAKVNAELKKNKQKGTKNPFKDRLEYAEFLKKHVNLPIAERTHISASGELREDPLPEGKDEKRVNGVLTVGFGQNKGVSGPEYPFGISFERMVDGPVLIVKCAVGGTSLNGNWRPTSLANAETPIEKAAREAAGKEKNVKLGPLWAQAMAHIKEVLADPEKFHPDYDPKAGVELAGLIWFQGWNDSGNKAYGEQFVHFIKDFRKDVNAPGLPVISGLMGHGAWKQSTFGTEPNKGMLYAAQHPELKGTVDIVNSLPYMPVELGLTWSAEKIFDKESKEAEKARSIKERAVSKDGTHYFGSAKFVYLLGDAMARKLAHLMNGGEPTIHAEAAEILGTK
jgi:hypothetical protein